MYPTLRTALLTCETGKQFERFRLQARALDVDGFWSMPASEEESRVFVASVQSLLEQGSKPQAGVCPGSGVVVAGALGAEEACGGVAGVTWRADQMARGCRRALVRWKRGLWGLAGTRWLW